MPCWAQLCGFCHTFHGNFVRARRRILWESWEPRGVNRISPFFQGPSNVAKSLLRPKASASAAFGFDSFGELQLLAARQCKNSTTKVQKDLRCVSSGLWERDSRCFAHMNVSVQNTNYEYFVRVLELRSHTSGWDSTGFFFLIFQKNLHRCPIFWEHHFKRVQKMYKVIIASIRKHMKDGLPFLFGY